MDAMLFIFNRSPISQAGRVRSPSPALVLKSFAPPRFPPFPIVSACDELRPAKLLWSPKVSLKACVLFESDMVQNLARALGSGPRGPTEARPSGGLTIDFIVVPEQKPKEEI